MVSNLDKNCLKFILMPSVIKIHVSGSVWVRDNKQTNKQTKQIANSKQEHKKTKQMANKKTNQ